MNIIIALDNKNNIYYSQIHNLICPTKDITISSIFNDLSAVLKLLEVQYIDILILDCTLPAEERVKAEQCARIKNVKTYLLEITDPNELCFYLYQVSSSYILNPNTTLSLNELMCKKAKATMKKEITNKVEVNEPIKLEDLKRIQEGIVYLFDNLAVPKHLKG